MKKALFYFLMVGISILTFANEDWKKDKFKWENLLTDKSNTKIITAGDINGDMKDDIVVLYNKSSNESLIALISNKDGYDKVNFDFSSSDIIGSSELKDVSKIKIENNQIKCLLNFEVNKLMNNMSGTSETELSIIYIENTLKLNKLITTGNKYGSICQVDYDVLNGHILYNFLQKKEKVGEVNSYYYDSYSRVIARKLSSELPINADLNKWVLISKENKLENNISNINITYGFEKWRNNFDITGKYYLSYDNENIYIIVDVIDDVFKQSNSGDKMLKGDHIELWFGTESNDKYQIGLNPGDFNNIKSEALLWFNKSSATSKKPLTSVIVNSKKTDEGYVLEAKIPLKSLNLSKVSEINKFTLVLSDSDFTDNQEKVLTSSSLTWGSLYSLGEIIWK